MNMHSQIEPENTSGELITVPDKDSALAVFSTVEGIEPILSMVRKRIDAFVPDMTTKKGRDAIKSMAARVAKSKTALDDVGKALVADLKELPKRIDNTRKHMRDTLDAWRDEIREPVTAFEAAEEARIEKHTAAIVGIGALASNIDGVSSEKLRESLAAVEAIEIGDACEEFADDYRSAVDRARNALTPAIANAEKREAEALELAELRRQAAERAEKDRIEQAARDAAERAKADAERLAAMEVEKIKAQAEAAKEAAERATKAAADEAARKEREAKEAADRAALALEDASRKAAQAEADARAKIERERQAEIVATAAREANTKHRAKINNAAVAALVVGGLSEDAAKMAVTMIAKQMIPHVSISY